MNDRINKTSICSIVFLDIIDYAKKTDFEKIEAKAQFNALINSALKDIAQNDRIILNTDDGVAIACDGMSDDALFIALTIRDEILKNNVLMHKSLYVRFGINQGEVRIVSDVNGQPNIIGDGINVARRIMTFAKPNQIVASRSYYEMTSRLTQEISQMFEYSGVRVDKYDNHLLEHEIYSVRSPNNQMHTEQMQAHEVDESIADPNAVKLNQNWKYALLVLPAIIAFGLIIQKASQPAAPTLIIANESKLAIPASDALLPNETIEKSVLVTVAPAPLTLEKSIDHFSEKSSERAYQLPQQKVEQKALVEVVTTNLKKEKKTKSEDLPELPPEYVPPSHKPLPINGNAGEQPEKVAEQKLEKSHEKLSEKPAEKSTWQTLKDSITKGANTQCTQAEITMNQCH